MYLFGSSALISLPVARETKRDFLATVSFVVDAMAVPWTAARMVTPSSPPDEAPAMKTVLASPKLLVMDEAGVRRPPLTSLTIVKATVLFFTRLLLASRTMAVIRLYSVYSPPPFVPMTAGLAWRVREEAVGATNSTAACEEGPLATEATSRPGPE